MQTWAKRGFQTALVTGGLLMLGTGIASAQENVNPDAPPSPLDAQIRVPIDVEQNNLGTPEGGRDLPEIHTELGTANVPTPTGTAEDPLVRAARDRLSVADGSTLFRGNGVDGDVVAPVQVCGNAVGAGGNAYSAGSCTQSTSSTGGLHTSGSRGSLAGNVLAAHSATPVGVTGNAIGVVANAYSESTVRQEAAAGGDLKTDGADGSLSGNIAGLQQAAPIHVTNNALGVGGIANSNSRYSSEAHSGGSLHTNGDRSSLGGNIAGAPLALVTGVDGNAVGAAGNADTSAENSSTATAGDSGQDRGGPQPWVDTSGENGSFAGNVAQPQFAGPVSIDDNALAGVGNADAISRTDNDAKAGGWSDTSGHDSTVSGNFTDAPIALPVGGAGNAGSVLGNTASSHEADTDTTAGGSTFTRGDRAVLSANSANAAPAGAADLCGNGVTGGGIATSDCGNEVNSIAGGYNGTTGNDSVLSGNIGQAPLGVPAEAFGNATGIGGIATGNADEHKTIRAGGAPNARDDNGTVSSNVITAPTAVGGQGFGNAGALVGNPNSTTDSDTAIVAGGPSTATGKHGSVSGNIVEVPTSNPAQVPGNTAVAVGNGATDLSNQLQSRSGGNATSTGDGGAFAGNVVSAAEASSPQVFGGAVGAGSNVKSAVDNQFTSFSGGDVTTSGNQGSVSGNGVVAQPALALQTFADSVTAAGNGKSDVVDDSAVIAGGSQKTEAWRSSLSGNLFGVPANAKPGAFGNAVTAVGLADANMDTLSLTRAGGNSDTRGSGSLTAHDVSAPVGARPAVFGVPAGVLGDARTDFADDSVQRTGEAPENQRHSVSQGIELPLGVDHLMGPTEMPNLSSLDRLSGLGALDLADLRDFDLAVLRDLELAAVRELGATQPLGVGGARERDLDVTQPTGALPLPVDLGDLSATGLPDQQQVGEYLVREVVLPGAVLMSNLATPTAVAVNDLATPDELPRTDLPELLPAGLPAGLPEKAPNPQVAKVPASQIPAVETPKKLPAANLPASGLPVGLPVAGLPVAGLPAKLGPLSELRRLSELGRVAEVVVNRERSFSGTLPLSNDSMGVTPVIQGLWPLLDAERGLPTAAATPVPLPIVVPVPGVAQPRTAVPAVPSTVPSLSGLSLSGLNVNPLAGTVDGPKAAAGERTSAPALAGLDAASVFGGMLGSADTTAVLPKI